MTAVIPVTGSTYHPRTPTPLTNFIHLQLGETTHREKPLSHDLLAKLVRHITFGKPRRAESATSDRHSRVRQSPFPSHGPLPPPPPPPPCPAWTGAPSLPPPPFPLLFRLLVALFLSLFLSLSHAHFTLPAPWRRPGFSFYPPRSVPRPRKEKKNNNGHTHRKNTPWGKGTRRWTLSQTITIPQRHKALLRGRFFPAEDHEGPSNNRTMRHEATAGHSCYPSLAAVSLSLSLSLSLFLLPHQHNPQPLLAPVLHVWTRARHLFMWKRKYETSLAQLEQLYLLPLSFSLSRDRRSRLTWRCFPTALSRRARARARVPMAIKESARLSTCALLFSN